MTKTHINLTIDNEILAEARKKEVNLSGFFEESIRNELNRINGDIEGIDIEIARKDRKKKEADRNKLNIEIKTLTERIDANKSITEEKRLKALEEERKRIESAKKCINCNCTMGEKEVTHQFPLGLVCHGCYLGGGKGDLKKWGQKWT